MAYRGLSSFLLVMVMMCVCFCVDCKKETKSVARREDIKFIKCGVCEEIVKQLSRHVKKMRDKIAPKKLTEFQIIELAENICNMKREEGDWILWLDIVEERDRLKLVEQQQEGECNTECRTIERACQEVMGDYDTDVAEFLFKSGAQRANLSKLLCKDLSRSCLGKLAPVPKDREPGEPFIPKSLKDAEMERLMRQMSDMPGAGGMKMYSRDDLVNNPDLLGGKDDSDEEDDEELGTDTLAVSQGEGSKSTRSTQTGLKLSVVEKIQDAFSQIGTRAQGFFVGYPSISKHLSSHLEVGARKFLQGMLYVGDRAVAQLNAWWYGKVSTKSPITTTPKSKSKASAGEL